MSLEGKVAIVTGASRGLGKAIALGLAGRGARVAVAARTETALPHFPGTIRKTVEEIQNTGGEAIALRCDVTDEAQVASMVAGVEEALGPVDILVNNAGVAFHAPLWEMPLKRWDLVLRVNLTGPFLCTRAVLPSMIGRKTGSIVNISSVQAHCKGSVKSGIAYGASKAALERFTEGAAWELAPFNIAVNCLKPRGAVLTEGMAFLHENEDASAWDSPDMMVKACLFLADQEGEFLTGLVATDEEVCARYNLA